jgi:hypothetical protein
MLRIIMSLAILLTSTRVIAGERIEVVAKSLIQSLGIPGRRVLSGPSRLDGKSLPLAAHCSFSLNRVRTGGRLLCMRRADTPRSM